MSEKPIIFSGAMVRAILDGSKTQTRRVVQEQPAKGQFIDGCHWNGGWAFWNGDPKGAKTCTCAGPKCPYGDPGDRLWVRETFALPPKTAYWHDDTIPHRESPDGYAWAVYREGWERVRPGPWKPSIHMPRWASRINLINQRVRVERVQDISPEDCIAEGIAPIFKTVDDWSNGTPLPDEVLDEEAVVAAFADLWDSINGKKPGRAWDDNPCVWPVDFKKEDT